MESTRADVLLIDDDPRFTRGLMRTLTAHSISCTAVNSAPEALQAAERARPAVVLLDLILDDSNDPTTALFLISELLNRDDSIRVLVLTGHHESRHGIAALERGAASFLAKPPNLTHLLALVRDGLEYSQLKRLRKGSSAEGGGFFRFGEIVSANPEMAAAIETATLAASTDQPLLIIGETGTGKGILARAIHLKHKRAAQPFVRCLPNFANQDLAGSELFGHRRGAFTGAIEERVGLVEAANRGTLFIDEVDELPRQTQVLLLHVLQEKTFRRIGSSREERSDFRLISASNISLEKLKRGEKLRADLFHRLAHLLITIPPLRERAEDIERLALGFLASMTTRERLQVDSFSAQVKRKLLSYSWPGNIRELEAAVTTAVARAAFNQHRVVELSDLRLPSEGGVVCDLTLRQQTRAFEYRLVRETLERCDQNKSKAATLLGLDRSSLRRIVERRQK